MRVAEHGAGQQFPVPGQLALGVQAPAGVVEIDVAGCVQSGVVPGPHAVQNGGAGVSRVAPLEVGQCRAHRRVAGQRRRRDQVMGRHHGRCGRVMGRHHGRGGQVMGRHHGRCGQVMGRDHGGSPSLVYGSSRCMSSCWASRRRAGHPCATRGRHATSPAIGRAAARSALVQARAPRPAERAGGQVRPRSIRSRISPGAGTPGTCPAPAGTGCGRRKGLRPYA